jgi:hypothetical protein
MSDDCGALWNKVIEKQSSLSGVTNVLQFNPSSVSEQEQ